MQKIRESVDPDTELALRGRPMAIPVLRIEIAPPQNQSANAARETPLLGLLRRRKWTVLLIAVACGLGGLLLSLFQAPKYRAVAAVEIEGNSDPGVLLQELLPAQGNERNLVSDSYVETRARLLREPALVEQALSNLNWPEAVAINSPSLLARLRRLIGLSSVSGHAQHDSMVSTAIENLDVHVPPQSHLIEISFDAPDAETAAKVANALSQALVEHDLESRWRSAKSVSEWLARPLQEFKAKYEKSATTLQNFAYDVGLMVNADKGTTVAEDSLYQLQEELSHAMADRITKQSRYELARSSPEDSLPEILDNGPLREYQLRLADLKKQLTELEATFTPKFPKVGVIRAQIAELTATIAKERQSVLGRLKTEYESAARREQLVSDEFGVAATRVAGQAATAIQYDVLKREMEANRTIYESMLQKEKEAGIAAALHSTNIRMVSPARPPLGPYSPRPFLNAGLAAIAGSFFSFVFFFTREHLVRTFHNPGELSATLQTPEFGVIPAVGRSYFGSLSSLTDKIRHWVKPGSALVPKQIDIRNSTSKAFRLLPVSNPDEVEIAAAFQSESAIAVSIRSILASLWVKDRQGRPPRIVLVSSSRRREGKTTLATNLAILLAQTNRRVLLIDGNLRNPRLHTLFDLPNTWGLSSILNEDVPVEEYTFEDLASRTRIPGLYVIPAGSSPHQVSTLQYQERLEELIARCRIEFHAVFIDTPPALDFSADARILGTLSDGVILAVKAGETRQEEVEFACRMFRDDNTQVLGLVLNKWDSATSRNWKYQKPAKM
jgi:succinoglycan biosynthesis transport protein ExoP